MLKNVSTKAIPTLFKLLVFFTPTIFVANTQELFEFPKMYFVYAVGTTIIWLFLVRKIQLGEKFKWPSLLVWLFLCSFFLSTFLSSHSYTSIWGYYTRFNGGLASILVFVGLYWVAINEFSRRDFEELAKIACLSLIPVGIYAVAQHYEVIANVWRASTTDRAFSTFGQPNWLAAYVTMLLPISLMQVFSEKEKNKALWIFVYAFGFAALWFSQSISGILGFAASIVAFIYLNRKLLSVNRGLFTLLMLGSILFAVINPSIFGEKIEDAFIDAQNMFVAQAQDTEALESPHNISDPGFIRQHLWSGTYRLITSSPKTFLIGGGPETFAYEFQNFRSEELNYSSEWNFVFNKPHNYYLELFANIGLVGLVAYLLLVGKSLIKRDSFFTPGLVALFVTNIFGWPTVSTALLFWLFFAGIESKK